MKSIRLMLSFASATFLAATALAADAPSQSHFTSHWDKPAGSTDASAPATGGDASTSSFAREHQGAPKPTTATTTNGSTGTGVATTPGTSVKSSH